MTALTATCRARREPTEMYQPEFEETVYPLNQSLPGVCLLLVGVPALTTLVMTAVEYVRSGVL
jgi:hypothetical protein